MRDDELNLQQSATESDASYQQNDVPQPKTDDCPTTQASSEFQSARSPTIGPYKLLQKLGEGGMGTVWMAEQEKPVRRRVALKVIKAGLDNKQVIARFEAERQALSMMNHENIAKILDVGTSDIGQPYFVMELVQGIPFNRWCDTNKLSINNRLELFIPVCKAVQHAHQKGIIHRDLKPSNVLVCSYDGRPVPKIIDFGLAKALGPNIRLTDKTMFTEFGQVVGTLQYMSPEQAEMNQLDIDTRTDVYSLGVMLYEILTGSTPIDQQTLQSAAILKILECIRETDPPRPSVRLSSITNEAASGISAQRQIDEYRLKNLLRGELDWIVMKSIEKNRSRRYETANDFADDIQRYLNNEVVSARPPSTRYRLQKYVFKNKGLVAALVTITALLVSAVAISSWFAIQANNAKLLAEKKTDEALLEKQNAVTERMNADAAKILATSNEQLARQKTNEAVEESKNTRRQLLRFYVANGVRFAENNAPWEALSWYAKAWKSAVDEDASWESSLKMRIGAVMADAPKLAAVFFHEDKVFDAILSPDGMRLVTIPKSDEAWLFDVASQSPISRLQHNGTVLTAAFSPDGATLVTGGADHKVRFWDSASGKSLENNIQTSGDVRSIDFHPKLPMIVVAAGEASAWDIHTGQKIVLNDAPRDPWYVKFSNDGQQLLVAFERLARVWNTADWNPAGNSIEHTSLAIGNILDSLKTGEPMRDKPFPSFSPDGKKLVVFGTECPKVVDLASGNTTSVTGHRSYVNSAAFSSDGKQLLICGYGQKVNVYNTESWELTNSYPTPRSVLQAAWHPSLPIIIAASAGGVIHWINAVTGEAIAPTSKHALTTSRVNFTPDGSRALVADLDGTVRLWELKPTAQMTDRTPSTVPGLLSSLSPKHDLIARALVNGSGIMVVNAQTGAVVSQTPGVETMTEVNTTKENVFYSPNSNLILNRAGSSLRIWDANSCRLVATINGAIEESDIQKWLKFSSDGSRFLAVDRSRNIGVFETATGNLLSPKTPSKDFDLRVVSISADGEKWAMGGTNSQAEVFDSATGSKLFSVPHRGFISGICFSENGEMLATASLDNTCRLWDARTGKPISAPLRHNAYVWAAKFSPKRMQVVTCGNDHKVRLWDIRTGSLLANAPIDSAGSYLEFSQDGENVFFTGADGSYKCWTLPNFSGTAETNEFLVRLLTGRYVDDTDGFTEVGQTEFIDNLESYRKVWALYTGQPITPAPSISQSFSEPKNSSLEPVDKDWVRESVQDWHTRNATLAETNQDWFADLFHLNRLAQANPDDAALEVRVQIARSKCRSMYAEQRKRFGITAELASTSESSNTDRDRSSERARLLLLNQSLWERVSKAPGPTDAPVSTSEAADFRNALSVDPKGAYFNTLAAVEYRLGNYEAAIAASMQSLERSPIEMNLPGPHPIDLAILGMSHFKLGSEVKAKKYGELLDETMEEDRWKDNAECLSFAEEMRDAIR